MTEPLALYPAIDLKGGRCVRLIHGAFDRATVYHDDPAEQARLFQAAGFGRLHIVDLDGALSGRSENGAAVEAILAATGAEAQLGGGVRDLASIEFWLARGLARVILGTAAVRDPGLVRAACRKFPGRIAIGVDARDGLVRTDGWSQGSALPVAEVARRLEGEGVAALIFTDIARDGALAGVNVEATAALAAATATPVIASGGVAGHADIAALAAAPRIAGVIIGRALYDGRIGAAEAFAAARR